jgi:tight adherence protein C
VIAAVLAAVAAGLAVAGLAMLLPRSAPAVARRRARGRHAQPPALLQALVALGAGAVRRVAPADVERRIEAAGRPRGLGAREAMAAKIGAAVASAPAGAVVGAAMPGRLGVLVVVAAPLAGFLAPDLWLVRRAAERARVARRQLPALLDLLRVAVDAGAALPAALAAVGSRARGPVAAEWRAVARQVELGVPLDRALAGMAARLPLPEVRALAAALERSHRHGVPLGATLAGQARDTRLALRRHVQEEAARAGPKIQLVVALLLVPSVLLLVAAALLSALLGSGAEPLPGLA